MTLDTKPRDCDSEPAAAQVSPNPVLAVFSY